MTSPITSDVSVRSTPSIAARDPHEEVDLTAEAVRLQHLGDLRELFADRRQLGLAHGDLQERLDREAERLGRQRALVRQEHAAAFEAAHAGLHGVAREAELLGERDDGGPRVGRQRAEKVEVDGVELAHAAKH